MIVNALSKRTFKHLASLEGLIGKANVSAGQSTLYLHSHDESYHRTRAPDAVVFPTCTEDVAKVAKYCYDNELPIIPFGLGSGFEGGITAPAGGVSVDTGLIFPIDPGADATIGGMCSTSASGTAAVRYGTMKENTINLEVVLSDGRIIHTGGPGRHFQKSSAGFNLTELLVGSEGTLGIITQATVRLHAAPEYLHALIATFETIEDSLACANLVLQNGVPVGRMEFVDPKSIDVINKHSNLENDVKPTLFFELIGSPASVQEQLETVKWCLEENNVLSMKETADPEERKTLWKARHMAYYATLGQCRPGQQGYSTDACVPQSKLTEMILSAKEYIAESKFSKDTAIIIGHVGDGNFHIFTGVDPSSEEEIQDIRELARKVANKALELGGTCTGEHGIGLGKKQFLVDEKGHDVVELMKSIKNVFDPKNIMNPGKIFF
ncbi:Oidioi.mRNA.OKI2018_I69.XSR.g15707.t1.cds [Oikopleura dioica]|uniref:D-lactate dehydrogenase (cytochrome) n=1 Tax=Oikopleura dioica TaxID=34765 RepID=A0ABN7SFM3_OIKDI|nr:Oidioi.mRNA.OKI2018_I69.XSR.g15707.t1.cds [Oikopleura dioica]